MKNEPKPAAGAVGGATAQGSTANTRLVDQKNFPAFAFSLALLVAVIYVGKNWHNVITHPKAQTGLIRTLLSFIVGIPMGFVTATLLIAFMIIALTRRSSGAREFHEKLGQRSALGAIYGTLLAIHAAAFETGKHAEIDLLDTVARLALWATLVAISTCFVDALRTGYRTLGAIDFIRKPGAIFFEVLACLISAGVGLSLVLGLLHDRGW